jgi:hypothetical protein
MRDPMTIPVIRAEFTLSDGTILERDWVMSDVDAGVKARLQSPPDWLENPSRSWVHPQDPVTFKGRVRAGFEAEARELLGL